MVQTSQFECTVWASTARIYMKYGSRCWRGRAATRPPPQITGMARWPQFPHIVKYCASFPLNHWAQIRPDLDPNYLTLWWYSWKNFFFNDFEKKSADNKRSTCIMEKITGRLDRNIIKKWMEEWNARDFSIFLSFHILRNRMWQEQPTWFTIFWHDWCK